MHFIILIGINWTGYGYVNKRTNMPRIGIRIATIIPPVPELEPEAVAGETSWASSSSSSSFMAATGQEHVSGLLIEDSRSKGETNSLSALDGSKNKNDGSTGRSRRRRSRRRNRGSSGCGRSRPYVSNWIFLPSIIFTCLIGRWRTLSLTNSQEFEVNRKLVSHLP